MVMDGRDIGTVVLPDADVKIFLSASAEERARRRHEEMTAKGQKACFEQVLKEMKQRDYNDANRQTAPLKQANDAIPVDTTGNTLDQSIALMVGLCRRKDKKWLIESFTASSALPFFLYNRIRVSGRENIPSAPFIICANHTSLTDPLVAAIAMTRRRLVHFMAKSEFFDIPVFGWLLRKVKAFPVKRGKSDISAIKNSLRILRQGEILGIFPEGTRVDSFDASEAKTGAAMIAAKAMVPVIPVFISPGRKKLFSFR